MARELADGGSCNGRLVVLIDVGLCDGPVHGATQPRVRLEQSANILGTLRRRLVCRAPVTFRGRVDRSLGITPFGYSRRAFDCRGICSVQSRDRVAEAVVRVVGLLRPGGDRDQGHGVDRGGVQRVSVESRIGTGRCPERRCAGADHRAIDRTISHRRLRLAARIPLDGVGLGRLRARAARALLFRRARP